ncbi:LytR/AlgR family response regulator transcription factor [Thermophagus sp. OGC60D27]|uniref:LytR/AlgR family response regulator transcription factor n=1 Tax=Thermophagus sp. OGC60D27 TaxID=3458415 RepID=UPI004038153A
MTILIVEDEPFAATHLAEMLRQTDPSAEVVGTCASVTSAVEWIKQHSAPDLGVFDIQLGDGTSFDIFEKVEIAFPVVFATAYDQFAIKAFKVNSVDYLLKPIDKHELKQALEKFKRLHQSSFPSDGFSRMVQTMAQMIDRGQKYRQRFVVSVGEHIKVLKTENVACFYSEDKATYLLTRQGKIYFLDQSLNQLEKELDPFRFFRTSRKDMVHIDSLGDIVSFGNYRLKIKVKTDRETRDIVVSRDRIKSFKDWLENAG